MIGRLARPGAMFALVALATAWLCAALPVCSQEAYYWSYAQHPDLSYFDHPPMVAWLIWLGTAVFGDGSIGVRFGAWLSGLLLMAFGAQLLRDFGIDATGRAWWLLLTLATPILAMTHVLANPDPALVCCWTGVMFALWRARGGAVGWWLVAGLLAGLALLSKYTAAFLAVSGAALLLVDPAMRRQLRRPGPYVAVALASVVFLPVVLWNAHNHFESFRFQTGERFGKGELGLRWFVEFLLEQAVVVHPVLLLAILCSTVWLLRRVRRDPRALWLLAFGVPLPLWFLINSFWIQVKINWLAPAIVPLVLGVVVWWSERGVAAVASRWRRAAIGSLLLVPLAVPFAPALRLWPAGRGSTWTGWEEIAARAEVWEDVVDLQDGVEGNLFYFAADYRDAAQLGRNLLLQRRAAHPGDAAQASIDFEPTLAQNVLGLRALQFDHWYAPRDRIGQDAIFVLPRPDQRAAMVDAAAARFASIERVEHVTVDRLGMAVLDADIYICRGYRGPDPAR